MDSETSVTAHSLDQLFQHALDGVFVIDRQRRTVLFSDGCERITGYHRVEVVGKACPYGDDLHCHDDRSPTKALFEDDLPSAHQRMQIHRKDGSTVWVETVYTPVRDRHGRVESILGVMRDVSEDKETEVDSRRETSLHESTPGADESTDSSHDLDQALAKVERDLILRALKAADGQRNKAAEIMKISRSRLYRRMEALGIHPDADA